MYRNACGLLTELPKTKFFIVFDSRFVKKERQEKHLAVKILKEKLATKLSVSGANN